MTVQIIALILLAIRIVTVGFISVVILRQFRLFKLKLDSELTNFRWVMFFLSLVFLLGNILPILININYAFFDTDNEVNLLVYYAISNALTSLVASILLWNIYRIAGREIADQPN